MFRQISAPISVQWELTSACNLNCLHCYNYWRDSSHPKGLHVLHDNPGSETIAKELVRNGVFQVTLTGGEPLTALKKNLQGLTQIQEAGIDININTNLALLTDERLHILKSLGIKSILTSLMAHDARIHDELSNTPGSFEATRNGINKAVSNGFKVAVNMVVTKKNLAMIRETGRFVKNLGAVGFCATKASKPSSCQDFTAYHLNQADLHHMFKELLSVKEETGLNVDSLEHYPACAFPDGITRTALGGRSCSAGKTGCTIGFNGLVRPCSHAQQTYGNIADGFHLAWQAMHEWRSGDLVPQYCKNDCGEFPNRCGGGCRVEAENCSHSLKGTDPFCTNSVPPARVPITKTVPDKNATFLPAKGLRFRNEDVGQIAYASVKNWLLIDNKVADLLKRAHTENGVGFTLKDLALTFGVSEERAYPTLHLLVSKKLVS